MNLKPYCYTLRKPVSWTDKAVASVALSIFVVFEEGRAPYTIKRDRHTYHRSDLP